MIFFNAEEFISEAIASVLGQTFMQWELLLIDDGSTDKSTQIALQYTYRYPGKIFYYHHDDYANKGMSTSRNLGISKARGEYIAFLDSDDLWLPQKLDRQIGLLSSMSEAEAVFGPTEYMYSWGDNQEKKYKEFLWQPWRSFGIEPGTILVPPTCIHLLLYAVMPCICSLVIKRDAIERIEGFDETFTGSFEDQVFYAKLYAKVPMYVDYIPNERYRQHAHSCCAIAEQMGSVYHARLKFLEWLENYIITQDIENQLLYQMLGMELFHYRHNILYRIMIQPKHLRSSIAKAIGGGFQYSLKVINKFQSNTLRLLMKKQRDHTVKKSIFKI